MPPDYGAGRLLGSEYIPQFVHDQLRGGPGLLPRKAVLTDPSMPLLLPNAYGNDRISTDMRSVAIFSWGSLPCVAA